MKLFADVQNVPESVEKYVVARYDTHTKKLWFWGTWDTIQAAMDVVNRLENAVMLEADDGI